MNRKTLILLGLYVVVMAVALMAMPPVRVEATCAAKQTQLDTVLSPVRQVLFGVAQANAEASPCGPNGICVGKRTHYDCNSGCRADANGFWVPVRSEMTCDASTCTRSVLELVACGTQNHVSQGANQVYGSPGNTHKAECVKRALVTETKTKTVRERKTKYQKVRVVSGYKRVCTSNGGHLGGGIPTRPAMSCYYVPQYTYTWKPITVWITKTQTYTVTHEATQQQIAENPSLCLEWKVTDVNTIDPSQRGQVPYTNRTCVTKTLNCCSQRAGGRTNTGSGGSNGNPAPTPTPAPPQPSIIVPQKFDGEKVVYLEGYAKEMHDEDPDLAGELGLPAGTRNMPIRFDFEIEHPADADKTEVTVVFQQNVGGSWEDKYTLDVLPTEYDPAEDKAKYEQFSDPDKFVEYANQVRGVNNGDNPNDDKGIWQHNQVVGLCPGASLHDPYICLGTGPLNAEAALIGERLDYSQTAEYLGQWRVVVKYDDQEEVIGTYRIIWYVIETGG